LQGRLGIGVGRSCWPPVVVGPIDGVPILIDEGSCLETLKRGAKTLYSY